MSLLNAGGGGADLQLGREHDVGLLNRLFVNEIERHAGCHAGHFHRILADGGQADIAGVELSS